MTSNDSIEFQTNISKTYTSTHFKTNISPSRSKSKQAVFSTPDSKLLDSQYSQVGNVQKFDIPIPDQANCKTYEEYLLEIAKWKNQFCKFSKTASMPVPIAHTVPRMEPPQVISPEEWSDNTIKRRLIRAFKPETSLLCPQNMIYLHDILRKGDSYDPEQPLPEKGLNGADVLYKYQLNEKTPWSSTLIPQRASPDLYETYEEYESAMLHWGSIVDSCLTTIPPNSQQVGEIMNLNQEGKIENAPPTPPIQPHQDTEPLSKKKITESKITAGLQKLMKAYNTEILQLDIQENGDEKHPTNEIPHYNAIVPDHCHFNTVEEVVKNISEFGVPVTPNQGYSLTRRLREERSLFDVGLMAQKRITKRIPNKAPKSKMSSAFADAKEKEDKSKDSSKQISKRRLTNKDAGAFFSELKNLVENNIREFFMLSMSPKETRESIEALVSGPKTLGEIIFEKVPLEEILKYSLYSDSERYLAKFSMIVLYMLQFPQFFQSILKLDINSLERFVELISFSSSFSFSMEPIPEEEVTAAIDYNTSTKMQNKIDSLVTSFRQTQLIYMLYQIIISSSEKYIKFLSFLRDLIHKSLKKVVDILSDESLIIKILDDFHSTDQLVHNFSYRIIRIIILLQYTKVIRLFSRLDLIKFMQRGLNNPLPEIQRDSRSLWQLMMHTDTSIALQIQLTDTPPSLLVSMIKKSKDDEDIFRDFLLSIVALFKETKTMFSFRPIPFPQFQGFLTLLSENTNQNSSLAFLHIFLTLCINTEAVFCFNRKELVDFINKLASTCAISLTKKSNEIKMKCLKVLYRIHVLEPTAVNLPDVWDFILTEMSRKADISINYRLSAWMTFRNALLHQKNFAAFILGNEVLAKKFDAVFSSFDERVVACLITTLTDLASVITKQFGLDESTKDNLTRFFEHMNDVEELVAAKLLMASKIPHASVEMAKMHSYLDQFFVILLNTENNCLRSLVNQPHFKNNLVELLKKSCRSRY